ncbi:MAG: hypothetical protein AB4062_02145 [Crocosphaera sp.]
MTTIKIEDLNINSSITDSAITDLKTSETLDIKGGCGVCTTMIGFTILSVDFNQW